MLLESMMIMAVRETNFFVAKDKENLIRARSDTTDE